MQEGGERGGGECEYHLLTLYITLTCYGMPTDKP